MPNLTVREAQSEDSAIVAGLVHALLDELSGGAPPDLPVVRQNAETVLAETAVAVFLAFVDDMPVGIMTLNTCMAIYAGGEFGEISELYIRPDLRSQGIAQLLLDQAWRKAVERGWKRIEVGAPSQPQWRRTYEFYLRNGFAEVGPRLRRLVQI